MRLFAILREHAGAERIELSLPAGATVADALRELAETHVLSDRLSGMPVAVAVNREYSSTSTMLRTGDELALIPPLSGGSDEHAEATSTADRSGEEHAVASGAADVGRTKPAVGVAAAGGRETKPATGVGAAGSAETRVHARVSELPLDAHALSAIVAHPHAGAIVTFAGVTRDVAKLDYEAYVEMAAERMRAIAADCVARTGVIALAVEHRIGAVPLGEPSVIVAASAPHRAEAFAAAREAIDRIKAEAPIWKQEVEADGTRRWVDGIPAPTATDATPANSASTVTRAAKAGVTEAAAEATETGGAEAAGRLTHVGRDGRSQMVDVGAKPESERVAVARARVRMSAAAAAAVQRGDGPKGEVLSVARIAGIQAGKQTGQLIPLAHPLPLTFIDVRASVAVESGLIELVAEARTVARTGVEIEAITAASVAAITVYDMVKGLERDVQIEQVVLLAKRGGRSGDYTREED